MIYILLAVIAGLADLVGGFLPFYRRLKFVSLRYAVAFASGTVISAAFFELLPESRAETNWYFLAAGFFVMYLIDKGQAVHQCGERECELTGVTWITLLGMASDNIIDGAGIAVAYLVEPFLGISVTLAVVAHEIPQAFASTLVMQNQGYSFRRIVSILSVAGVMYPVGASLSAFIPDIAHPAAIAFVAGVFIYTGAHSLMVEAHRRFNRRVILSLLIGSLIILALRLLELG